MENDEKVSEESKTVIDKNTIVPINVLSSRANVPFEEVNEESTTVIIDIENINKRQRDLDFEDEQIQEKILDYDERTGDQTEKIRITESTDTAILEPNESDNHIPLKV